MTNNDHEPVIGSRLKMKFKFSHSSSSSPAPVSTDTLMVQNGLGHDRPDQNFSDPIIPIPTHTPSPPNHSPSNMGKRKKKPKKMDDEFLCDSSKRIKKTPFSKSDHDVGSSEPQLARKKKNSSSNGAQSFNDVTTPAMIRAEEVQSTLDSEFPRFSRVMVRSHVINGFWMGVPGNFSREHLPKADSPVILVDESGKEFELKYNAQKMGLSAGWRNFSVEKKLLEGDVLIFQLVEPCKFKVYLVRTNDFKDVDGALSLLNLEALMVQNDAENDREQNRQKALSVSTDKKKRMKSLQPNTLLLKNKISKTGKSVPKTLKLEKKLENGYRPTYPSSYSSPNVKNIENFDDFTIMVDGLCIDSELPEDIRAKYYDLCSSRNKLLHGHLLEGLNSKLIAGIICQIVNISGAIRRCSLMTSDYEFENWDMTLKSFQLLGMIVGFLRRRVSRLHELAFVSEGALEMRKYVEAKGARVQAEDDIVNLETKIIELKEASKKYSADVENLQYKAESFELKFQEEANAPW